MHSDVEHSILDEGGSHLGPKCTHSQGLELRLWMGLMLGLGLGFGVRFRVRISDRFALGLS